MLGDRDGWGVVCEVGPWLLLSFAVCREAISVFEGCEAVISRKGRLVSD